MGITLSEYLVCYDGNQYYAKSMIHINARCFQPPVKVTLFMKERMEVRWFQQSSRKLSRQLEPGLTIRGSTDVNGSNSIPGVRNSDLKSILM